MTPRIEQKTTRVLEATSSLILPPSWAGPCPGSTVTENLTAAPVPSAHVRDSRTCNPSDNGAPRYSLPQRSPDRAGLRESTLDLFCRASADGTRDRQSPNARRSVLPQPHASSCHRAPIAAAAERSIRYCVQDSKMHWWLFRKRTRAVDSLMLLEGLGWAAQRGFRPPDATALSSSNRGSLPPAVWQVPRRVQSRRKNRRDNSEPNIPGPPNKLHPVTL